jgi:serine/threonine-protein kinase
MSEPTERWRRVEEIFYRALDRPPEEREEILDAECSGDAGLREEVASLLAEQAGAGRDLESLIERAAAELVMPEAGRRIGPYRLLREIGHGGMGVVYLAERADGAYRQEVAVKLVQGHVTGEEAHRRFLGERQILARLEHPAIARLLDGGTTEEGTPYLVMEYVDGEPIDRWCRRRGLGVEERLRLFLEVCDAVASAHRQLVVHRDLKPSNLLVDGDGRPRLLDFGVAKLLDDDGGRTRTSDRALTPGYASPEQVLGEPITTATDVYGLGVVLYELLTGRRAFPGRRSASAARLAEMVRTETPPRPSVTAAREASRRAAAETAPAEPTAAAGDRAAEPAGELAADHRLARSLQGELDAIVMTALRPEPERRYPSVAALADDLRSHLGGLPVSAHSERWGYLAGKWMRRHRGAVAAAALLVVSLALGIVGTSVGLARSLEAEARARREAETTRAINDFLEGMLSSADPVHGNRDIRVAEALDLAAAGVAGSFGDRPEVEAGIRSTLGRTYLALGRLDEAERQIDAALELRRNAFGERSPETAAAMFDRARLWYEQGRQAEAEMLARSAVELQGELLGPEHPVTLHASGDLAGFMLQQGKAEAAHDLLLATAEAQSRVLGPDHPEPLRTRTLQAQSLYALGRLEEAEALTRDTLAALERIRGGENPATLAALGTLAGIQFARGRLDELEGTMRRLLAAESAALGEEHPSTLDTRHNLALVLQHLGRLNESEALARAVLESRRRLLGPGHPRTFDSTTVLITTLARAGRPDEALELGRGVPGTDTGPPDGHPSRLALLASYGEALAAAGRTAEAVAVLERCVDLRTASLGPDHPDTAESRRRLDELRGGAGAS